MIKTFLACLLAASIAQAGQPQKAKPMPLIPNPIKFSACHCDSKGKLIGKDCPKSAKCVQKAKKK